MTPVENQTNLFPRFSDEEYARRYRAVRQAMEEQDVHAILVFGARGSSEVHYISNYLAQSPCWILVPRDGEATCFIHFFNHQPCAKAQSIVSDVRWYGPSPIPTLSVITTLPVSKTLSVARCQGTNRLKSNRPFAVGREPSPLYRKLFDVALECYENVKSICRPSITNEELIAATSVI